VSKKIPVKKKKKGAVIAKGKVRQTRIEEDADALVEFEKKQSVVRKGDGGSTMRADEVPTKEIINVWAVEIQDIYNEFGTRIDRTNAQDKAKTLLIELRAHTPHVRIRDHEFQVPDCGRHDDDE